MRERLPAGIPLSEGAQHSLYSQIHAAMLPGDHDKNFVFWQILNVVLFSF